MLITTNFSLNKSDQATHLLCNFHQLSLSQSRDIAKKLLFGCLALLNKSEKSEKTSNFLSNDRLLLEKMGENRT